MDEHLKVEFWAEVIRGLEKLGISSVDAEERVNCYRHTLDEKGVGDLVFHQEPDEIVHALAEQRVG